MMFIVFFMDYEMGKPFEHGYYDEHELRAFGFKRVGHNVRIAKNCTIIGYENVEMGDNVRIDGYVTITASRSIPFVLGSYIHIGSYAHICGSAGFTMHDFSAMSAGVRVFTRSDDFTGRSLTNPTVPAQYTGVTAGEIVIGKHAIVGSNTVILPSVKIGEGCAVGALSLVQKSLKPWGIYFGAPVRRISDRSMDLLQHEQALLKAA